MKIKFEIEITETIWDEFVEWMHGFIGDSEGKREYENAQEYPESWTPEVCEMFNYWIGGELFGEYPQNKNSKIGGGR